MSRLIELGAVATETPTAHVEEGTRGTNERPASLEERLEQVHTPHGFQTQVLRGNRKLIVIDPIMIARSDCAGIFAKIFVGSSVFHTALTGGSFLYSFATGGGAKAGPIIFLTVFYGIWWLITARMLLVAFILEVCERGFRVRQRVFLWKGPHEINMDNTKGWQQIEGDVQVGIDGYDDEGSQRRSIHLNSSSNRCTFGQQLGPLELEWLVGMINETRQELLAWV